MGTRVSFIVPTRNSEETIEACLRSIRAQTHPDVESIVVDNDSGDRTPEIAGRVADRVLTGGPERSAQRNLGAAAARGYTLVFIDSDMVLEPPVAEQIVRAFAADPSVQALVLPERSVGEGFWSRCRMMEKELYVGDPDVEAARAFRREAFAAAGGYDERMVAGGEDWDLPERIADAGGGIGRVEALVIHDEGRLTLVDDLRKKFYYGRSLARYARAHPRRAARKMARWKLLRALEQLPRRPLVVVALLVLKVLEGVAAVAGMVAGKVAPHPSERGLQPYGRSMP